MPGSIPLKGMRIGVNGAEPQVGQAYRLMDTVIQDSNYSAATGQTLSTVGTIIGLEQGPSADEFYLCFDTLGTRSDVCSDYAEAVPPTFVNVPRPSDIGFRTFDKINATMASVTGVSPNTAGVKTTFTNIRHRCRRSTASKRSCPRTRRRSRSSRSSTAMRWSSRRRQARTSRAWT